VDPGSAGPPNNQGQPHWDPQAHSTDSNKDEVGDENIDPTLKTTGKGVADGVPDEEEEVLLDYASADEASADEASDDESVYKTPRGNYSTSTDAHTVGHV